MENGKRVPVTEIEFENLQKEVQLQYEAREKMKSVSEEIDEMTKQDTCVGYPGSAYQRYEPSPREYLHNFLLQAQAVGCNVSNYIDDEIRKMLNELER